jgi:hypothetical protein
MEIIDYLRILRKRLWILIGIPVLGLIGVAAVVLVVKPEQYAATATVAPPALVGGSATNQYSGAGGAKLFVSDFESAATSNLILNPLSAKIHVAKATLRSGLTVAEVESSNFMNVTYTTQKNGEAKAASIAQTVASNTLLYLFQTQVQIAQKLVTGAQAQVNSAQAAVTAYQTKIGVPEPDQRLQTVQTTISQLEQTQAVDQADGDTSTAANLNSSLNSLRAQQATLENEVSTFNNLQAQVTAAQTRLNGVTPTLQAAQAQFAAANPSKVIAVGQTEPVSRKSTLAKAGGVAVGAGLFLAVLLIALLEILRRARQEKDEDLGRGRRERAGARAEAPAAPAPSFNYRPDDRDGVSRRPADRPESARVYPEGRR